MTTAHQVEREGLAVGLIASVSVAVFYAAIDQLAARGPLYTVNLLGRAVFRGARDSAILQLPIALDAGAIALYSAAHLLGSLTIGIVVTRLIAAAERHPAQATRMLALIVVGFLVTILVVGRLTVPMRPLLPWWSIVLANTLAVVLAGSYLLARHPGLWGRFFRAGETEGPRDR
jgi:hypothetical protein